MTYDDHVMQAIERGARRIGDLRIALPLFMRADIRASLNRLMWRGRVRRVVGTGYLPVWEAL